MATGIAGIKRKGRNMKQTFKFNNSEHLSIKERMAIRCARHFYIKSKREIFEAVGVERFREDGQPRQRATDKPLPYTRSCNFYARAQNMCLRMGLDIAKDPCIVNKSYFV